MNHFEYPGPLLNNLKRKEVACVCFSICLLLVYLLTRSADPLPIEEDLMAKLDDKIEKIPINRISIRERMLEHVNFTDILQIFTDLNAGKRYSIVKRTITIEKLTRNRSKMYNSRDKTNENQDTQLLNCMTCIVLAYLVLNTLFDAVTNYDDFRVKYDEFGNKIDGANRKYSLADYASMRHSRKNSEISQNRTRRIHSTTSSKRPLLRYDSLGTTQKSYTAAKCDSLKNSYGGYGVGSESPVVSCTPRISLSTIGARPPPLSRRSSFPSGPVVSQQYGGATLNRQGSGDSGDSSPDAMKRRYRLIRRH